MTLWQVGPYVLSSEGLLRLGGQVIPLSPLQRRLLLCFVCHAGQLIERKVLIQRVWDHNGVSDVSLARAVHSLRQVFDRGPLGSGVISTSYGSGYVFTAPVVPLTPEHPAETEPAILTSPQPLALECYYEARVASRHLDPNQLQRSMALLERALQISPTFLEAILFQVCLHLNRCRWGLVDSRSAGNAVEALLHRAEQCHAPQEDLIPLRAETITLLHWQPELVEERFANWLPEQLGYGLPLLSWVRHLLACGRAQEGLTLLQPHLDGALPMGWTLTAQLTFQLGQTRAAMEMLRSQLGIEGSAPPIHLFLAVLQAHLGDRVAALKSLAESNFPSVPFRGFHAAVAYVLARVGEVPQAEALIHKARRVSSPSLGMPSVWGLGAMALGRSDLASAFFAQALEQRCYQAPFLAKSPLLMTYAREPVVQTFQQQMVSFFPLQGSADAAGVLPGACSPSSRTQGEN